MLLETTPEAMDNDNTSTMRESLLPPRVCAGDWGNAACSEPMKENDDIAKAMDDGNTVSLIAATSNEGFDRCLQVQNDACFFMHWTIYNLI
jgi:hypothetical protein